MLTIPRLADVDRAGPRPRVLHLTCSTCGALLRSSISRYRGGCVKCLLHRRIRNYRPFYRLMALPPSGRPYAVASGSIVYLLRLSHVYTAPRHWIEMNVEPAWMRSRSSVTTTPTPNPG